MNGKRKKVTISDVADAAQVSLATVSRVLNHPEKVKRSTYYHITDMMKKLGYTGVRQEEISNVILIIIPNLENAFYTRILDGIFAAADRSNYHFLLRQSMYGRAPSLDTLKKLCEVTKAQGIIFLNMVEEQMLRALSGDVAVVQCCECNLNSRFSYVTIDDYSASKKVVHYKYNVTGVSSPGKEAWKRLSKNKTAVAGMLIIVFLLLVAVFADVIAPYGYQEQNYMDAMQGPSAKHLFGTDNMGRDIFSRCVYGARYSLPIGIACVCIGLLIGGGLGLLAAYFGGTTDNVIMRFIDIIQAIPSTLLCISLVAILGNGIVQMIIAIAAGSIQGMTKSVRAAIFMVRNNEYVDSSKSVGVSDGMIMIRHLVPNAVGMIVINAIGNISGSILTVSTLSYIGIGLVSPTPEWGAILSEGKTYMSVAPHMVLFPGLMIAITVVAFNLFGNGLRDALDPRLK